MSIISKIDFNLIKKHRLIISLFIIVIIIIAIWGFSMNNEENTNSKHLYFIYYDHSDFITALDDTITFQEGEVFEESYMFEAPVSFVHIILTYSEDRYLGGNDEIEYTITPPPDVENLSQDFLTSHYNSNSFSSLNGAEINGDNFREYYGIIATTNESAIEYYLDNTNLTIGSGKWGLKIEYIGDGPLNLDTGGEIHITFQYRQACNWRAEVIENGDFNNPDYHEAP